MAESDHTSDNRTLGRTNKSLTSFFNGELLSGALPYWWLDAKRPYLLPSSKPCGPRRSRTEDNGKPKINRDICSAPATGNFLPRTVTDNHSLGTFKSRLKTFLFSLAFKWQWHYLPPAPLKLRPNGAIQIYYIIESSYVFIKTVAF